jgi:hypothetical protein
MIKVRFAPSDIPPARRSGRALGPDAAAEGDEISIEA